PPAVGFPLFLVEVLVDAADAAVVGLEWLLERPGMSLKRLRPDFMHAVIDVPEPQIRVGQRRMQRLGCSHRHQALLVRAAENNGDPHHAVPLITSFVIPGCAEGADPESRSILFRDSSMCDSTSEVRAARAPE